MVIPAFRSIFLAGAIVAISLLLTIVEASLWIWSVTGLVALSLAMVLDIVLAASSSSLGIKVNAPSVIQLRDTDAVSLVFKWQGDAPSKIESRLGASSLLDVVCAEDHQFILIPKRRGYAILTRAWIRWKGPLGLIIRQSIKQVDIKIPIRANTRSIEREAVALLAREARIGSKVQIERGEGAEFDALREFQRGMDVRAIDWKQSARHRELLTREFRAERNSSVIFAIDTGRLMSDPVEGSLCRLDHAINAALMMAFASLKFGDKVGLFAFDEKPHLRTGTVGGPKAFGLIQGIADGIDYSNSETNFTLALTTLASDLDRRSLIVIFADFADPTSAELMVENVSSLLRKHVVLFVAFRDLELENLALARPERPQDVARSVVAETLLQKREIVLASLRQKGVEIIDAVPEKIGIALINSYIRIKRQDRL